jgi:hypothetical protein
MFPKSLRLSSQKEKILYLLFSAIHTKGKGKGKAIPLKAWTDPEGSRRLRLPAFKTIGT